MSDLLEGACEVCKGACCEVFGISTSGVKEDTVRWLGYHGMDIGGTIAFNCRCSKLDNHGKCSVYDSRPEICKNFPVGSSACLQVVKDRRSPAKAARIFKLIARMGKE